jgi:hypothetical protein
MQDGRLLGSGTTIICDERGAAALAKRNIRHTVKKTFTPEQITRRFIP